MTECQLLNTLIICLIAVGEGGGGGEREPKIRLSLH